MQVIANQGINPIKMTLMNAQSVQLQVECAQALREIGKHSPEHAKALAEHGVLNALLQLYLNKS